LLLLYEQLITSVNDHGACANILVTPGRLEVFATSGKTVHQMQKRFSGVEMA